MSETEAIEQSVRAVLDRLGAAYEVIPCDPALADTAVFCAHYGVAPSESANTIVVASRKEPKVYAACLALATTKLDVNHKVSELLGVKKLSFASPEETVAVTGMMIGGVTPFGLSAELPFYVDSRIATLARRRRRRRQPLLETARVRRGLHPHAERSDRRRSRDRSGAMTPGSAEPAQKDVLGLLLLVAAPLVEAVRGLPLDAGPDPHVAKTVSQAPRLCRADEVFPQSFSAVSLADDQTLDLRDGVVGEAGIGADVNPACDRSVGQLRDEQRFVASATDPVEARLELREGDRIAELVAQRGDGQQVFRCHLPHAQGDRHYEASSRRRIAAE
jgi:prolyl-tRNA editing enzyme YbaK/EbsC (Cys-tRNA(Pro) deacylase)